MDKRTLIVAIAVAAISEAASVSAADVTVVGRRISVASVFATPALPMAPATVVVAQVAVPNGYRSKSHFLDISTSAQESCGVSGDGIGSLIVIGAAAAEPDVGGGNTLTEAANLGLFTPGREWFLVPESAGGPAIPPGAIVQLRMQQGGSGSCGVGATVLKVRVAR
jgi:hypothetical protein